MDSLDKEGAIDFYEKIIAYRGKISSCEFGYELSRLLYPQDYRTYEANGSRDKRVGFIKAFNSFASSECASMDEIDNMLVDYINPINDLDWVWYAGIRDAIHSKLLSIKSKDMLNTFTLLGGQVSYNYTPPNRTPAKVSNKVQKEIDKAKKQ